MVDDLFKENDLLDVQVGQIQSLIQVGQIQSLILLDLDRFCRSCPITGNFESCIIFVGGPNFFHLVFVIWFDEIFIFILWKDKNLFLLVFSRLSRQIFSQFQNIFYKNFRHMYIPCFAGIFSPLEITCRGAKGFEFGSKFEDTGPEAEVFSFNPFDQAW